MAHGSSCYLGFFATYRSTISASSASDFICGKALVYQAAITNTAQMPTTAQMIWIWNIGTFEGPCPSLTTHHIQNINSISFIFSLP
jgi:hypothetical protein